MIVQNLKGEQKVALSHPQLLRRIFSITPSFPDEVIPYKSMGTSQNDLLSVISACCTLGLFLYQSGCWCPTRLGYMISMIGPLADPVEMIGRFPFTETEMINSRFWAESVLFESKNKEIISRFFKQCTGWYPDRLEALGEKESVIQVCSALVTLRKAWFTGYSFEPTLNGLWFAVSPDSPLNKQ